WVGRALRGVKFRSERDPGAFLGAMLAGAPAGDVIAGADFTVPVPMHVRRERERGYNQAAVIAEHACRSIGREEAFRRLLTQPEERPSQVGLNARERRENVRGSFSLSNDVALSPGKRYVIVDDVRTTGSTLAACIEALRPLRPARVDVVTFAAELRSEVLEAITEPDPRS
ncbi:MAG: hypothetical protein M3173_05310, partial [Chloroflexota bacterium]|nr:hypothetical protein [Chloroflexota bacterium]